MATQENSCVFMCEDLVIDILFRLPEKDLIRCKCVSKEWLRIISLICVPRLSVEAPVSGPYFHVVQAYDEMREVTTSSPEVLKERLRHYVAYRNTNHFINCAPLDAFPEARDDENLFDDGVGFAGTSYVSLLPFTHRGADMLDCCNGLLLFVRRPKHQYYVCNPAIRESVPIPPPPPSVHLPSLYASLAFDPFESIHYRVVILSLTTKPQCLHIFHSQTGNWTTNDVKVKLPFDKSFQLVRYSVYVKGALYRLSLLNKILRIDLESLNVYLIDRPCGECEAICTRMYRGVIWFSLIMLNKPSEPVYVDFIRGKN